MMKLFLAVIASAFLSGCAAIVGGTDQTLVIDTVNSRGEKVANVACTVKNSKGEWLTVTPSYMVIGRSHSQLEIACNKPSYPTAFTTQNPSMRILVLGNIVFGGPIGLGIDLVTGAAFDYPPVIPVVIQDVDLSTK